MKVILIDKFHPSIKYDEEYREINNQKPWEKVDEILDFPEYDNLYKEIQGIIQNQNKREHYDKYNSSLANVFLGRPDTRYFTDFYNNINNRLFKTDYYCACFFYHRLGVQIRMTGNVSEKYDDVINDTNKKNDFSHVYDVVTFINKIIKGIRFPDDKGKNSKECRIVIDSIRNSLEARYLKERYSAFYLIAVHDEEDVSRRHLYNKLMENYALDKENIDDSDDQKIIKEVDCILKLGVEEQKNDNFEEGIFAAPNLSQCVADAEIHISNTELQKKRDNEVNGNEDKGNEENDKKVDGKDGNDKEYRKPIFYTMAEQWMKYASLILHPGLITPSAEERCMVVAYTAKFNSGCLSRQVGAFITNKAHSIRSIGWNDVPYGQVSCSLRSLYDYMKFDDKPKPELKYMYSDFESGDYKYKDGLSFKEKINTKYPDLSDPEKYKGLGGLPLAYCFKTLHNEFEDKKNQVHTRSLHAEENAILQMARFGGEGLENGVIYVTASPCELCCKKLYQIGVRKIIYIDEYPGISRQNIIATGFKRPALKQFQGAYGVTYFKLYQPFMPMKDELALRTKENVQKQELSLSAILRKKINKDPVKKFSDEKEMNDFH